MRTRSRTTNVKVVDASTVEVYATTFYCSGAPAVDTHAPWYHPANTAEYDQEFMADDSSPSRGPKQCYHNKRVFRSLILPPDYGGNIDASTYAIWHGPPNSFRSSVASSALENHTAWNLTERDANPQKWIIPTNVPNESSLIEDCFEKARGLKADGLLNVVEANQIWPSLRSLASSLPVMAANWNRIRKVIKTASGAYLAWKFGVSPILSDIMSIRRYLPKLRDDIGKFGNQGKSRFSASASIQDYSFDDSPLVLGPQDTQQAVGHVLAAPVVRYVLVVEPNRAYHTDAFKALDVCMQRFTSTPASIAWELVPFSFVVDWFVDLRGALRKVDTLLGFEPFKVVSFTRSRLFHVVTEIHGIRKQICDNSVLNAWNAGTCEFRHYERTLASSQASLPSWKPRFGKSQAGITAALIGQMLFSKKH